MQLIIAMDVLSQFLLKTYDDGVKCKSGHAMTEYYTFSAAQAWASQHDFQLPHEIVWINNS